MAKLFLVALFCLLFSVHAQDSLIIGGFGQALIDQIASEQGFFEDEDLAPTFPFVSSSDQQFDSLDSGAYDLIATVGDNVIYRRLNLGRERYTVFAERDASPGLWLIANEQSIGGDDLEDITGKTILTDSPVSGFVTAMRRIFQVNDIPLEESLLIPSGGLNQRITILIAGNANATMSTGAFSYAAVANNPDIVKLAEAKDVVCPYLGTQIVGRAGWASIPANHDKLVRFLRAELRAWEYLVNPANKATLVARIQTSSSVDAQTAELIYNATIASPDTGLNLYLVPRMRAIIKGINMRVEDLEITRAACLPLSAELVSMTNGWIDVEPLQEAGAAINFYNVYGTYYDYPESPCEA